MVDAVTREDADEVSSRAEIFNSIEAGRVAEINKELEESGSDQRLEHEPTPEIKKASGKDATDDAGDDSGDDDPDAEAEAERVRLAAAEKADKGDIYDLLGEDKLDTTKVKIKVDGVEREVSVGELARGHQKNTAADKRLEDAAIARRQAEQVLVEANTEAERIKQEAKNSVVVDDPDKNKGSPSGKDAIQSAMSLVYEGNQEEAAGILDAEINRRVDAARSAGATVDPAELADRIKTDLSWDAELSAFNRDHKDIAADPELARMFQRHLNEAAQTSTTPHEAIEKATEAVTGWLEKVSGQSADDGKAGLRVDQEALRQRQADKARQQQVRSNSSIRSQSRTEPEEEYNPSAVVAEMKKARGQS